MSAFELLVVGSGAFSFFIFACEYAFTSAERPQKRKNRPMLEGVATQW